MMTSLSIVVVATLSSIFSADASEPVTSSHVLANERSRMPAPFVAGMIAGGVLAAEADSVRTDSQALGVDKGVVTAFVDARTNEGFRAKIADPLSGLRRLGNADLWTDAASVQTKHDGKAFVIEATWQDGTDSSRMVTRMAPDASGDVLVTQRTESAKPGLVGIQWGLVVPDSWQLLVPGHSGLRFSAAAVGGRQQFGYPTGWEAQFILLHGKHGGILIYAQDVAERFKTLHLDRKDGHFLIGLETRCTAPFEEVSKTTSVAWRIHPYQGDWLVGAGAYREWATKAFGLPRLADRRPGWVKDIQLVVIGGLDKDFVDALAKRTEPRQTLIYVPGWRRDGYDRNYPDYTPSAGFEKRVTYARKIGFRVMLHVNYFGVTPENADYERLRPYHCRDPFTKQLLYWDWQRAKPPIKFAYINPAAKAWRDLFVRRMVELCERVGPDDLHLDQTLCIFNHAGGLIDGMNMMQGNMALHRELREALPDVALSGEGLNEITCRYEAFAQRHVWGINHTDQDWSDASIAQAHPVSSSLLAQHTTIYGYLGMANPQPEDYYFAWRRAYEHFGVIPTLTRPSLGQITSPPPIVRVLLAEAQWFQTNRPVPDFAPGWPTDTLFAYRTSDGGKAAYRKDETGVVLAVVEPKPRIVSRRLTGASSVSLPGTIPNWHAYNREWLIGLDPDRSYVYLDEPRKAGAFHVCCLPATTRVGRISLRPDFVTLRLEDRRNIVADLWRFDGPMRCGERLVNGQSRQTDGASFVSDSGTRISPEGEGIFAHPPWRADRIDTKGATNPVGLGSAWIECDVTLPSDRSARFESGVGLRTPYAAQHSDGVMFRVTAWAAGLRGRVLRTQRHARRSTPERIELDLTEFRGRRVTIRLETHPGPVGSVTYDWALWTRPRILLVGSQTESITVRSPRRIVGVIPGDRNRTLRTEADDRLVIGIPVPGTTYLLFTSPRKVEAPTDLWKLSFTSALVLRDGGEVKPHGFMSPHTHTGTVGGVAKPGLFAHPPSHGQNHVDWLLVLPAKPVRLTGFAGIRDGAEGRSSGVGFRVAVNGEELWRREVKPDGRWVPLDVSLGRFAGLPVVLTLITDALGDYTCDWAQWGEIRIVTGEPATKVEHKHTH